MPFYKRNVIFQATFCCMLYLMPAKEASNVYTNFVDVLEEQQLDALDHLEEVLLDPEPSFLLKKKFERSSFFQTMKLDGRYNSELNSD